MRTSLKRPIRTSTVAALSALTLLVIWLLPSALLADSDRDDLTGLWTFFQGDIIRSDEVNENFSRLGEHQVRYENAISVDDIGQVGIGTEAPQSPLHVVAEGHAEMIIENDGSSDVGFHAREGEESAFALFNDHSDSTLRLANYLGEDIQFSTNRDGCCSPDETTIMTLKHSTGNVGIGTDQPISRLHVTGDAYLTRDNLVSVSLGGSDEEEIYRQWSMIATHDYGVGHRHNLEFWQYVDADSSGSSCDGGEGDVCTTQLSINEHGHLGIGTTLQKSQLAVSDLPSAPPPGDESGVRGVVCITHEGNMWVDDDGVYDCQ